MTMNRPNLFKTGVLAWFVILIGAGAFMLPTRGLDASVGHRERVEISAPILPSTNVLYAMEGDLYPSDIAGEMRLAHEAALTFDSLMTTCAPTHPQITTVPAAAIPPLTAQQIATNYQAIAQCSYDLFKAKPYWIPALVNHVDICGAELGAGWRLISEDDLSSLSDADAKLVAGALPPACRIDQPWATFFDLTVWIRGSDGTLKQGSMHPGASARVTTLPVSSESKDHYEGGLALRCIRRTPLPDDGNAGSGGENGTSGGKSGSSCTGATGGAGGVAGMGATGSAGGNASSICDGFRIPLDHPNAAADYDTTLAGVVSDAVTGLMWERAPLGVGPLPAGCPRPQLAGFSDWRLPTLVELETIVDFAAQAPAIDSTAFPGTPTAFFATSSNVFDRGRLVGGIDYGWTIDFKTGATVNGMPPQGVVRCVRAAAPLRCRPATGSPLHLTSSVPVETMLDERTSLSWQKGVSPQALNWADAKAYCASLGVGFRLPGVKELLTIADRMAVDIPIDPTAFPGTPKGAYWTASLVAGSATDAWTIDFTAAVSVATTPVGVSATSQVRCVR